MINGAFHRGNRGPAFSGALRPVPGWASHRMPIPGLYQTGGSTHPGGSITGAPGRNAAMVLLADLGHDPAQVMAAPARAGAAAAQARASSPAAARSAASAACSAAVSETSGVRTGPPDMPASPAQALIGATLSIRRALPRSQRAATARTGSRVAATSAALAGSPASASAVYSRIGCQEGVWYRYGAAEDM